MVQSSRRLKESPSQTAGPYVHIGATPNFTGITGVYPVDLGSQPLSPDAKGERIVVTGRIFDGSGTVVKDALVEIWQADAQGLYPSHAERRGKADPHFPGWFRQPVDGSTGIYRFETVKPGPVPYFDGRTMAPHVTFWIVARGINIGLHTRLYFGDEASAMPRIRFSRASNCLREPRRSSPPGATRTACRPMSSTFGFRGRTKPSSSISDSPPMQASPPRQRHEDLCSGTDIVNNGIALSGTARWMFDRGLINLSDVLIWRQANDADGIRSFINRTGRALPPLRVHDRPHPHFLRWHRENCFKQ